MEFLKFIFYVYALVIILQEIIVIGDTQSKVDENRKLEELKKLKDESPLHKSQFEELAKKKIFGMITFIWFILGIFTFQWPFFLAFLIFQIVIMAPLFKITHFNKVYTILFWLNGVISLFFTIFLVVNAYHLHIKIL